MAERDPDQPDSPPSSERRQRQGTMGTWLSTWARDTFSREQLISSFKSFLWVAPLTILIWVYAEREQPAQGDNQVIIFAIKSNDPRIIVTMVKPQESSLMAQLRGSRVNVLKVKELLTPKNDQAPVTINISPDLYKPGGGPYTVSASIIADHEIFRDNKVTVSDIRPTQIEFTVDIMWSEEVEVQTPPLANFPNLAGAPAIEPRKVTVTGPKTLLETLAKRGDLRVMADFSNFEELKVPNKHELTVPLSMPNKEPTITVSPSSVKVSLEVQQLRVEEKWDSIPIYVSYPRDLDKAYHADYDGSARFVTLLGPAAVIKQMQNNAAMYPKARFEVVRPAAANPAGSDQTAELKWDLPEGVTVAPADAKRMVSYKLVEKKPDE